ncbi:four helix bundle protein [Pontimicrobium sp. SW4]|uniref:Four helix bundle protein n=1 Tax=Pontimicrobium sp. SW4 TaxID=3153519 RepID=A0AAU7BV29_9FLAO
MENNHTYRKLLVWQKSMLLVTEIYNEVKIFPSDKLYALTSQIKRSATSIPSNIAEGYGREGTKDYLRFLNIALSSLFELQTQLEIAYNLKFFKENNFENLYKNTREIERMLTSFIRKLKGKNFETLKL